MTTYFVCWVFDVNPQDMDNFLYRVGSGHTISAWDKCYVADISPREGAKLMKFNASTGHFSAKCEIKSGNCFFFPLISIVYFTFPSFHMHPSLLYLLKSTNHYYSSSHMQQHILCTPLG